jgi:hypothetical protein
VDEAQVAVLISNECLAEAQSENKKNTFPRFWPLERFLFHVRTSAVLQQAMNMCTAGTDRNNTSRKDIEKILPFCRVFKQFD